MTHVSLLAYLISHSSWVLKVVLAYGSYADPFE